MEIDNQKSPAKGIKYVTTFAELNLKAEILDALATAEFSIPTPVQCKAMPYMLSGRDLVVQAETGSGKTLAYALPVLQNIVAEAFVTETLIIVPTRELARQVFNEFKLITRVLPKVKVGMAYGGTSFEEERASFTQAPHILIATPGRLLDHLDRRTISLRKMTKLVIDEADKLFELGFKEQIGAVLSLMPIQKQVTLYSATISEQVMNLISKFMRSPHFIRVDSKTPPISIVQKAILVAPDQKDKVISNLLPTLAKGQTIIFCNTQMTTIHIGNLLLKTGFVCEILHGKMEQMDREKAIMKFKNKSVPILVATDIAARGIDVKDLDTVIQLELPDKEAGYIHRCGRTGRAGNTGTVYSICYEYEANKLKFWPNIKIDEWLDAEVMYKQIPKNSVVNTDLQNSKNTTLHISAGKKDKISAKDIVGTIIAEIGLESSQIGNIQIHQHFSFVAVPTELATKVCQNLNGAKIKGRKVKVTISN